MKKTITIGISAYNEAKNILKLLDSIINQRQRNFVLEKIIVACDGCTDNTATVVRRFVEKYPVVQLIDDGNRIGKSGRLNNFCRINRSDIIVIFDADTTLGSPDTLLFIAEAFGNLSVGLVAGADIPYPPETFFESIVVTAVDLWRSIRLNYNDGDTVHNSHGCILAISKDFSKKLHIQENVNGADHFFYFKAKEFGFDFKYAEKAIVYYREPNNLSDFISQRRRFYTISDSMTEIFGEWIIPYYKSTPLLLRIKKIVSMFFKHPILLPLAIGLQLSMNIYMEVKRPERTRDIWDTIQSTK